VGELVLDDVPADPMVLRLSSRIQGFWHTEPARIRQVASGRHEVGLSQILWSSDFPHATCDFLHYDRAAEIDFAEIPTNERDPILCGNVRAL
jgi:predicted TIM-barrel fold metal-dependent hydrolase